MRRQSLLTEAFSQSLQVYFLIRWSQIASKYNLRIQSINKTQLLTIIKINWLTLFKEIIAVLPANYTKPTNTKRKAAHSFSRWDIYLPLCFKGVNQNIAASFQILSYSSFMNHPIMRSYILWGTDSIFKQTTKCKQSASPWGLAVKLHSACPHHVLKLVFICCYFCTTAWEFRPKNLRKSFSSMQYNSL